jgi:hypothetical protein
VCAVGQEEGVSPEEINALGRRIDEQDDETCGYPSWWDHAECSGRCVPFTTAWWEQTEKGVHEAELESTRRMVQRVCERLA